ncbi:MAG: hypothetical protein JWP74_969 [Marmoricola sp.]|nr:hypothetical protein [Marmoricola sp.]
MTIMLALLEEGTFRAPYIVGGGILLVLFTLITALMAFGRGREHS